MFGIYKIDRLIKEFETEEEANNQAYILGLTVREIEGDIAPKKRIVKSVKKGKKK